MIGLDTNVVVRLLVRDDREQAARAATVFESGPLWLAKTVLLETEWVLRSAYSLPRESIADGFRALLGYPPLEMEDHAAVVRALRWYGEGLDFADALHLASLGAAEKLITFDAQLGRTAATLEDAPPVEQI